YEGPDPQLDHIEGQRQVISLRDVYRHRFDHRLSTCETVYDWRIRTWESGSHEILEVTAYFNISDFPKVGDDRDFVFGSMVDKLGWKQIELSNIQAPVFSNTMEQTMEIYSDFAVCERPGVVALAFSTEGDFYFEVGSDGRVEKFIPLEKWHVWPSRRTFVYDFGVTDLRDGFCDPTSLFVTDKEYSYEIPFDMLECFRVYEKVYIRDETWIYDRISGNVILVQDQVGVTEEIVVHANLIVSVYDSTIGMDVGHLTIED
uniref:hypothetical protein n=1 Tax=Methanohalobium sp. TaxID=2837493 RepID=UPI0025F651E6